MDNKALTFLKNIYEACHRAVNHLWSLVNRLTGNYLLYFAQAIRNFATIGQNEAGGFAYWALFSLFPLILLALIIAISLFGSTRYDARLQISATLKQFLPASESSLIQQTLQTIVPRRTTSFSIISIIGLVFGANRLFTHLQWSLSRIFRDETRRPWHLQVLTGAAMMLILVLLVILSLALTTSFRLISAQIAGRHSPLIELGGSGVLILVNTVMLTMLYRFIPRRKVTPMVLFPVAFIGAIVWELGRYLFDWYLQNLANLGVIYGSLGALVGLLIWMFFIGSIISLCAEIAVATDDWRTHRPRAVAVEQVIPNIPADQLTPEERSNLAVSEPSDT